MGQSRSSVLLYERNGAFSDILHTNPHLVGRSHPVSVEVREFDWDSSRKGASQLSRTKTIRLSTPKTTTGEILIFALTSPIFILFYSFPQLYVRTYKPSYGVPYNNYVFVWMSRNLLLTGPLQVYRNVQSRLSDIAGVALLNPSR